MRRAWDIVRCQRGQMVVELAMMVPVVIVVAIIIANLAYYASLCARFDRIAPDIALAHGVSPTGEQDARGAVGEIESALAEAMGDGSLDISVRTEPLDLATDGVLSISPFRVRIVCSMGYRPHPTLLSLAGVTARLPVVATHEASVVADLGSIAFGGGRDG